MGIIARLAGAVAAVLGVVVLCGWWAGIPALVSPVSGAPAVMPNTALLFLLGGVALLLRARGGSDLLARRLADVTAALMLLLSAATLVEYAAGVDLGIDRLLAQAPAAPAPNTALGLLLMAVALLLPAPGRRRAALIEALALLTAAGALLVILGYPLGVIYFARPFELPASVGMALPTAMGLLALATGVLALRSDAGLTALLTSEHSGGAAARLLLPVSLLVIPLAAVGADQLEQLGVYPHPGGIAVATVASLLALVLAVRMVGRRLDRADEARVAAERELERSNAELVLLAQQEALQRARLETVLRQMPEGVVVVDQDGQLVAHGQGIHPMARDLQPPTYDVRRPSGEPLALAELPVMRALRGEVIAGEELLVVPPDGHPVPILASAQPVHTGDRVVGAVTVFRDITAIKELERLREEWTSIIAHDLRQPVNTIMLTSDMLLRSELDRGDQVRAQRIRDAIARLDRMVGDLLDLSSLESQRLQVQREPLRVDQLLSETLETVPAVADRCRLDVGAGADEVLGDRTRVIQIMDNLVTNAAKYGEPGSPIVLRARRSNGHVQFTVENRGPGIAADELSRLFNRFQRTNAARRSRTPGLGLGLYICRGLVEAQGGRIWAESLPDGTTCFNFTLPLPGTAPAVRS